MSEPLPHILVAEPYDSAALAKLEAVGRVTILSSPNEQSLLSRVGDCEALLVRTAAQVTRAVIEQAPLLRVIARGGVGLDNIDLDAARQRGVAVVHTPDASSEAVADLTVGLMIGLIRNIRVGDELVRAQKFSEGRNSPPARELHEMTLGIVGLGRAGRAVASRCRAGFCMTILYNDIVSPGLLDFVSHAVTKEELFRNSDIISLHVPLTDLTRGLINAQTLELFKPGAYLINTARGAVVDSLAVTAALQSGRLAAAAFDVFDSEPPPLNHPLLSASNTLFTPHIGARTVASLSRMNSVVDDVIRVLRGQEPRHRAV